VKSARNETNSDESDSLEQSSTCEINLDDIHEFTAGTPVYLHHGASVPSTVYSPVLYVYTCGLLLVANSYS